MGKELMLVEFRWEGGKEGGVHTLGLPFLVKAGKIGGENISGLLWRREPVSSMQKDEAHLGLHRERGGVRTTTCQV